MKSLDHGHGKRIAIVYRCISGMSGVPGVILDHAHRLSDLGYRVTLIGEALDTKRIAYTGAKSIRIQRWPLPKLWRLRWFAKHAGRLAESYDFIVGHGHTMRQHVYHMHNCLRLAYEKTYGYTPNSNNPTLMLQERMLRQGEFKICIANSRLARQELIQHYGISQNKIHVVYPGSDLSRFSPEGRPQYRKHIRMKLDIDEATVLVGLITSGEFLKRGVDIAIKAFSELSCNILQRTKLLIIGKESRIESFRVLVDKYDLGRRIQFLPPTPQVEKYYHALDLYIHPARFEEFGLSVQEAMACGLPVIASRQVGAMELLPQEAWDSIPVELDVAELAERMRMLIEDENLRRQWQEYSRQAVEKNSDIDSFQRVLALYRQAGL